MSKKKDPVLPTHTLDPETKARLQDQLDKLKDPLSPAIVSSPVALNAPQVISPLAAEAIDSALRLYDKGYSSGLRESISLSMRIEDAYKRGRRDMAEEIERDPNGAFMSRLNAEVSAAYTRGRESMRADLVVQPPKLTRMDFASDPPENSKSFPWLPVLIVLFLSAIVMLAAYHH